MDPEGTQGRMLIEVERELTVATAHRIVRECLPDETRCAGRQIARSDMVVCMAGADHPCEFSVELGCRLLCFHPRRLEIAARQRALAREQTQALRQKPTTRIASKRTQRNH